MGTFEPQPLHEAEVSAAQAESSTESGNAGVDGAMGNSVASTQAGHRKVSALEPQPLHEAETSAAQAGSGTERKSAGAAVAMPASLRVQDKSFWYDMTKLH